MKNVDPNQIVCCFFLWRRTTNLIILHTDYGRPMKPFFIEIPNFWADRFCGIWGIFGRIICTHFGTGSPLAIFIINQPLLLQKLSLYIHIPNIYLGLGFEFGPQRIRDLAFVCPQSVAITILEMNCEKKESSLLSSRCKFMGILNFYQQPY